MEEELERWDHSEEVKALEEGEKKGKADKERTFVTLEEINDALSIHNVFEDSESDLMQWVTKGVVHTNVRKFKYQSVT
eukprot:6884581-Ditylum_brightwellii.AAC.1